MNDRRASPAHFVKDFTVAAVDAQKRVTTFKAAWRDQETQALFERVRKSLLANSDLSAGARVPMYGWNDSNIVEVKKTADVDNGGRALQNGGAEDDGHFERVDVAQVVDDFRRAHPSFKVDVDNKENWVINVRMLSRSYGIALLIFTDTIQTTNSLNEISHHTIQGPQRQS